MILYRDLEYQNKKKNTKEVIKTDRPYLIFSA